MKNKLWILLVLFFFLCHTQDSISQHPAMITTSTITHQKITTAYETLVNSISFCLEITEKIGLAARQEYAFETLLSLEKKQASFWFQKLVQSTNTMGTTASKLYGLYGLLLIEVPQQEWRQLSQLLWEKNPWVLMNWGGTRFIQSSRNLIELWESTVYSAPIDPMRNRKKEKRSFLK